MPPLSFKEYLNICIQKKHILLNPKKKILEQIPFRTWPSRTHLLIEKIPLIQTGKQLKKQILPVGNLLDSVGYHFLDQKKPLGFFSNHLMSLPNYHHGLAGLKTSQTASKAQTPRALGGSKNPPF